jgi:hypothetical protein
MTVANRTDEFEAAQRESVQVAAELRKVLASVCRAKAPSPVPGGFGTSPFRSPGIFVLREVGVVPYMVGTETVLDRRNSRLPW